jgi:hypothetical protein
MKSFIPLIEGQSVLWNPHLRRWVLQCSLTGDRDVLPDIHPEQWQLRQDAEGQAYVCAPGQQPVWTVQRLTHTILPDPKDEKRWVITNDDGLIGSLQDFKAGHAIIDVPMRLAGTAHPVTLRAYRLARPWDGAVVWWSLKSLHEQIHGKLAQTPSQWYQNWWQWWGKRCVKLGLQESHLRKASPTKHAKAEDNALGLKLRCFEEACCSSFALLALWPKWAMESNHKNKDVAVTVAWRAALMGFLTSLMDRSGNHDWQCFADSQIVLVPGQPLQGHVAFHVQVRAGRVPSGCFRDAPQMVQQVTRSLSWEDC